METLAIPAPMSAPVVVAPEPDVWWGEDGIDAGLGLIAPPYEYPATTNETKE